MSDNYVTKSVNIWTGRVEDTKDPLYIGRSKVRIFGVHSENDKEVPTQSLPWATAVSAPNAAKSFSTLMEGDLVVGYFQDGSSAQVPVIIGVLPGVPAKEKDTSRSKDPIKTDMPAGQVAAKAGQPTTPPLARSVVDKTAIAKTNQLLEHSCDFRYQINLDLGLSSLGLENPVTEIQNAIKRGKNKAAQAIRVIVEVINDKFREVVNALLKVIGFDPTGTFSLQYSIAKDLFREINRITKKVAKAVELAAYYVTLYNEIQQIVDYLKSLPDRIKAIVQQCIVNFLGAVESFVAQVKSIPGQVQGTTEQIINNLSSSTGEVLSSLKDSTSGTSSGVASIVSGTDANGEFSVTTYIASVKEEGDRIISENGSNSFTKEGMQSP